MENSLIKKLVIIPSDPIAAYESKGTSSWLEKYFNPNNYFDQVIALSPKEKSQDNKYGLKIIPVKSNKDFRKKLKEINPICVRAYGGYWATDYAIYNKILNIPVVSSIHDTNLKLIHKSLFFSDRYIAMSDVVKDILIEKKLTTESEINVLGNRVNTSVFNKIPEIHPEIIKIKERFPNGRMILLIGRKSEQKNIDTVIKSLKYLDKDLFLVLVGKGDEIKYKNLVKDESLDERVFFISKIENDSLPFYYNAAAVFCGPSRWEGFGLVFIEAGSCCTRIVTSNIAPMNEYLVNDHKMNYLVDDYENPLKISEAIKSILKVKSSNTQTRDFIIKKFDINHVSNKEIENYYNIKDLKKQKSFKYFIWKNKYRYKTFLFPKIKKIKKIPNKIWKKIF